MATQEERDQDAALLAWLGGHSDADEAKQDDAAGVLRYLQSGRPARREIEPFVKALLPPTRKAQRQDYERAELAALGWRGLGFTLDDVRAWLRAGLDVDEYNFAADLIAEGIAPSAAAVQFEHPLTGELVTAIEVVRRSYRDIDTSVSDALDEAGIERERGKRPQYWFGRGLGA